MNLNQQSTFVCFSNQFHQNIQNEGKLIINHAMCESEVLKNILPLEKVLQFTYSLQVYEEFTNFIELPKDIVKNPEF
jgi:hypothetical protein